MAFYQSKMLMPVVLGITLVLWWMQRSSYKKQSQREQERWTERKRQQSYREQEYLRRVARHLDRERAAVMTFAAIRSAASNVPVLQRDTPAPVVVYGYSQVYDIFFILHSRLVRLQTRIQSAAPKSCCIRKMRNVAARECNAIFDERCLLKFADRFRGRGLVLC